MNFRLGHFWYRNNIDSRGNNIPALLDSKFWELLKLCKAWKTHPEQVLIHRILAEIRRSWFNPEIFKDQPEIQHILKIVLLTQRTWEILEQILVQENIWEKELNNITFPKPKVRKYKWRSEDIELRRISPTLQKWSKIGRISRNILREKDLKYLERIENQYTIDPPLS